MVEYSYDADDYRFRKEEERQFIEEIEYPRPERDRTREAYERDRPSRTYRDEGIDAPDDVPLWFIEMRGRQRLQETFSDGDGDYLGNDEIVNGIRPGNSSSSISDEGTMFNLFKTDIRNNHWF